MSNDKILSLLNKNKDNYNYTTKTKIMYFLSITFDDKSSIDVTINLTDVDFVISDISNFTVTVKLSSGNEHVITTNNEDQTIQVYDMIKDTLRTIYDA